MAELEQATYKREQAEKALWESEKRYRDLVENLNEVIYTANENGIITYISPAIESLIEYTPSEVIGSHFKEFIHQEDLPRLKENFQTILSGRSATNEYRVLTKSGEIRWIRTSSQPTLQGTQVVGVHGVLTNITERKQEKEDIQQQAAQLEALRQVALELTAELDLDALLESIVSQAIELAGGDYGGLYLYRPERDALEWSMAVGPHTAPIGTILKRGEGLSGKVWETGESLIVGDYQSWSGRTTLYKDYPFRAVVGVPICWREEFLGVLNVLADCPGTFTATHAELLSLFATQAAIAIENARLFDAASRRAEEMAALHRIGLVTTSTLDLDEVLNLIYGQVNQLMKPDTFYIALYDQQKEEVTFEIFMERGEPLGGFNIKLEEMGLTGWIIQGRQPLLIGNMAKEPPPVEPLVTGETPSESCYVGVPIMSMERVIGVISVQSFQPYVYGKEDQRFLTAVAAQASIAIENARLYEAAQQEIRARKQAEEALQKSEARYRGIFENAPCGIWISDEQGTLIFANQATFNLFGVTDPAKLVGRWNVFRDTTESEESFRISFRCAQTGEVVRFRQDLDMKTVKYDTTREETVHFYSTLFPIQGGSSEKPNIVAIQEDITEQVRSEEEIRQLSQFRESIIDNANVWLDVLDEKGAVLIWNRAAEKISGYLREEVVGHNKIWEWLYPDETYRRELEAKLESITEGNEVLEGFETTILCKDGQTRIIAWNQRNLLDEDGKPVGSVAIGRDITEQKQAEKAIRELSQLHQSIIDHANVWLSVLDEKGLVVTWNKAAEAISGYSQEEAVGNEKLWEWLYPDEAYRKGRIEKATAIIEGSIEQFDEDTTIRCKDGQDKIMSWHVQSLHSDTGKVIGFLGIGLDVTERKRAEERLAHMATHDPLTGLPNRQAFNDRLGLELSHAHRNGQKLAVMMLDLDHFKNVNDTLGHSMGDQLLKAVGNRLTSLQRKSDTIARLGGDELMLILPEIAKTIVAEKIAQKLLDTVQEQYVIDGHKLCITTSIGVVIYPEDANDVESLVKNADIAMYEAKDMGRNTYQRYTLRDR